MFVRKVEWLFLNTQSFVKDVLNVGKRSRLIFFLYIIMAGKIISLIQTTMISKLHMYKVNVFRINSQLQYKNYLVGFKFDYFLLLTISHYCSQFRVPPRQLIIKEYLLTERCIHIFWSKNPYKVCMSLQSNSESALENWYLSTIGPQMEAYWLINTKHLGTPNVLLPTEYVSEVMLFILYTCRIFVFNP